MTTPIYGPMCIPGRADDGSDSAWYVTPIGRRYRPGDATYVGDGDGGYRRAVAEARRLNRRRKRSR